MNSPARSFTFLILLFLFVFATRAIGQQPGKNFEQQWKKVAEFETKGLPKSALVEVKKIYAQAKAGRQEVQVIKSLVYMTTLQEQTREDNKDSSIIEIEREIRASNEPAASILNSLLAGVYWNYFQEQRWQIYGRTATTNFKKDDIATWSANDFHKKISELYLRSIKEERLLQQTKLEPFDSIIERGNVRHLRPTLYDLLANHALEYFKNDETQLGQPAFAFELSEASTFDPASSFVTKKINTRDSLALQFKALLIYQRLIAFHLKDATPDALIDVDINRLRFGYLKSVHPDKDKLYLKALEAISAKYGDLPAASIAIFLRASFFEQKARAFKAYGDSTYRLGFVTAKELCEKAIAEKDSSEGKISCTNLLSDIIQPSLQFSIEKINVPAIPFRALLHYQNCNRIYLRLLRLDEKLKTRIADEESDHYWQVMTETSAIREWEQPLPVNNDMQPHFAEIKIDPLPVGEYILMTSTAKGFISTKDLLSAKSFFVSSISYINNGDDFFVLNRNSGQPIAQATVQAWQQRYDAKKGKYIQEKKKTYVTDLNGYFKMDKREKNDRDNIYLDISAGTDHLFLDDQNIYDYSYDAVVRPPLSGNVDERTTTYLFTDRSIYRPGQTIFVKGISIIRDNDNKSVVRPAYKSTAYLRDVNRRIIDSFLVETNDYGSFAGKFKIPQSTLNGVFEIEMGSNAWNVATIRVEEYKRPKFYVDFEKVKDTYKVNDHIKVTGFAKAYAGNNIDGAAVKYRVVRQPRLIYTWLYQRGWQPPTQSMEIAHGEIKTTTDGKFVLEFTAIPDLKIDKKFDPVFDYEVFADVTDINGESRSGQQRITAGYKSLLVSVTVADKLPMDSLKSLSVRTENLNGSFQATPVTITVTRLNEEKRLIRPRLWQRPDQFVMNHAEYAAQFPHDEYDNETDKQTWTKSETVFTKTDTAREDKEFIIDKIHASPGVYLIEASAKDKAGQLVIDHQYVELYDPKSKTLSIPQYLWTEQSFTQIEPGEKTSIVLGSSADSLFMIRQVNKGAEHPNSFNRFGREKTSYDFTATEADRGGYEMTFVFVKDNRIFRATENVIVPWTNKQLNVEYASFRDKTLPGSEEKWKLKISGYKKEIVAAEVLASMYDASLDQFYPHNWEPPGIWITDHNYRSWNDNQNFSFVDALVRDIPLNYKGLVKVYDRLLFGGVYQDFITDQYDMNADFQWRSSADGRTTYESFLSKEKMGNGDVARRAFSAPSLQVAPGVGAFTTIKGYYNADAANKMANADTEAYLPSRPVGENVNFGGQIRKNFNETAFFLPQLTTDSSGTLEFSFTLPEALTKWKFQALAHTRDLAFGYSSKEIITQKQLMIQPNAPRFVREGDKIEFSGKVVNLTDKEITGQAELQLFDAVTNESIDGRFKNTIPNQYFTVAAGQSEAIKFPIEIPYHFNSSLTWKIVVKSDDLSDGEQDELPVLTNRMLVTETMPINMRGDGTKQFSFEKLLQSGNSETLQHHGLTIEYTSNPAWYAVQALPYLIEYPYECAEQSWNRYYANSLAMMIVNAAPRLRQILEQWKNIDTAALLSNLQKNQELKSVLLEETPWVLEAKSESEQKKNLVLLFDMVRMSTQLNGAFEKLKQSQLENGGFAWFTGGPEDRYITQYIVSGIGHLIKLKGVADGQLSKLQSILASALPYLDKQIAKDYDGMVKAKINLAKYVPDPSIVQYLYMRSFFPANKIPVASQKAFSYFRGRAQQSWTQQGKYLQGMLALELSRTGDTKTVVAILKSLKETSINSPELGMYWKDANRGWWWYESPIERQSMLIEAFQEAGNDQATVDDLKTWLLKNKQANRWESTKATAEACYALLLQGSQWLNDQPSVSLSLGGISFNSAEGQEAGTGYFKKDIDGNKVNPQMGNIAVSISGSTSKTATSWGAVYWQYFEDLDKITPPSGIAATPLKLVKKLFVERNTDRGPFLTPVNDGDALKVGDKIKVRIELKVDRDMEYVHMKDMRASATEPINVLSEYKWQDGLGYYESTKDASTNFFFDRLTRGTYVFEYPLFVTHTGNFSNGVTTIQCMYAPEFASHSDGIRINVE